MRCATMFIGFAWLLGMGCGEGSSSTATFALVGDTTSFGVIWDLVFDSDDAPIIATETGVYRWDGSNWVAYPLLPPVDTSEILVTQSGALVAVSRGQIFRLVPSAVAWETLYNKVPTASRVIEASDGTLYALKDQGPLSSTLRVLFRASTDSDWTDSAVDVSVFCYPVADAEGNIWCENSETQDAQRVNKTVSQVFPRAYGFAPVLGHVVKTVSIDDDGTHWGMSHNYTGTVGEIWSWNPSRSGAPMLRVDGSSCKDGDGSRVCAGGSPVGGFITSPVLAPNGEGFQLWATQNGDSPFLMRVRLGGDWAVIADMTKPFSPTGVAKYVAVNPAALSLIADSAGRMYAFGSRLNPGALMGTSVVLRVLL